MTSKVLDAFKFKPFDLEPVYASWKDAPVFTGNSKKDPPVEAWMEQIKTGCIDRKVCVIRDLKLYNQLNKFSCSDPRNAGIRLLNTTWGTWPKPD
jgi:hypothetical protein